VNSCRPAPSSTLASRKATSFPLVIWIILGTFLPPSFHIRRLLDSPATSLCRTFSPFFLHLLRPNPDGDLSFKIPPFRTPSRFSPTFSLLVLVYARSVVDGPLFFGPLFEFCPVFWKVRTLSFLSFPFCCFLRELVVIISPNPGRRPTRTFPFRDFFCTRGPISSQTFNARSSLCRTGLVYGVLVIFLPNTPLNPLPPPPSPPPHV